MSYFPFKLKLVLLLLLTLIGVALYCAIQNTKTLQREPNVLFNKYHILKSSHQAAAKEALCILLQQNPNDIKALKELSRLLLDERKPAEAYPLVKKLTQLLPEDAKYPLLLLYIEKKIKKDAIKNKKSSLVSLYPLSLRSKFAWNESLLNSFQTSSDYFKFSSSKAKPSENLSFVSEKKKIRSIQNEHLSMVAYYHLLQTNETAAWRLIQAIITAYPHNEQALKAGGYLAIKRGHLQKAIEYFNQVVRITNDDELTMQLAYLYSQTDPKAAWQRFHAIANEKNNYSLQAQHALVNMSGIQTKAMPSPYFSDFYFTPFTQSRFGLTVRPFIARVGVENPVNSNLGLQSYLFIRQTDDNRSKNLGELPQIYEDNVRIFGVGTQVFFPLIPHVSGYIEAGKAYDLIPQNRDRWRFDLRSSLTYYNELGATPCYTSKARWNSAYYGLMYANVAYFSRYNNNVIGTVMTHQGTRLLQVRNTVMNLYLFGRVMSDTNRDFFNNFMEAGPGIGIIPYNLVNFQLRFEAIKGAYLPAGRIKNPYGKYYNNRIARLLFYVKI